MPPSYADVASRHARHLNPDFVKLLDVFGYGRLFVRAEGCHVWDGEGRRYLDLVAAYGANNVGHSHPRLVARLRGALDEQAYNFLHFGLGAAQVELAEALARHAGPLSMTLFANSGSEAVEAAMKLAIAATGRGRFLSCEGAYHGLGLGSLSLMGAAHLRAPFERAIAAQERVPWNDLDALEQQLRRREFAAFVVEPIQGEAGVVLPRPGYLAAARALCRRYGSLFVVDEVQTGLGRCGRWLASSEACAADPPDAVVLAKSLGGGLVPIGAALTTPAIFARAYGGMARHDLHSSTFGGGALACRVATETIAVLDDERLAERSRELGTHLQARLRAALAGHPLVREVRGEGLLVAVEVGPTDDGGWLARLLPGAVSAASRMAFGPWISYRLLERGYLVQAATHRWDVLKLLPPLTVERADLDGFALALAEILDEHRTIPSLATAITAHLARHHLLS